MALPLSTRNSFISYCSGSQEELVNLPTTPGTIRGFHADTIKTHLRFGLVEPLNSNSHVSQSGDGEDTPDGKATRRRKQQVKTPTVPQPGWLFKGLHAIQNIEPSSVTFSVSIDFSRPSGQLTTGKKSRQKSQKPRSDIRGSDSEKGREQRYVIDATAHTSPSPRLLKMADQSAHLHQWSAVKTQLGDNPILDPACSVMKSLIVGHGGGESTNTIVFNEALAWIFPYDSLTLLEQDSRQCISAKSKKPLGRCSIPAKFSMSAAEFARTVAVISQESCMTSQLDMIESLTTKILCKQGQHQQRAGRHLQELRAQLLSTVHSDHNSISVAAFPFWLTALSSYGPIYGQEGLPLALQSIPPPKNPRAAKDPTKQARCLISVTGSPEPSTVSSRTPSSAVVKVVATTSDPAHKLPSAVSLHRWPQNFQHWRPNSTLTVPQLIRQTLEKPVGERSRSSGYVYIYWNPGNFGYVKIGFTTLAVEKRLSQWEQSKCNHDVEEYVGAITRQYVPHVYRVESLIFAELRDFRLKELNCPCGKSEHQEWFKVTPQHVAKVRQKWENFMLEQERYETRTGGRLLRSTVSEDELDRLCRPLNMEEKKPLPSAEKALRGVRRSSRLRKKSAGST